MMQWLLLRHGKILNKKKGMMYLWIIHLCMSIYRRDMAVPHLQFSSTGGALIILEEQACMVPIFLAFHSLWEDTLASMVLIMVFGKIISMQDLDIKYICKIASARFLFL